MNKLAKHELLLNHQVQKIFNVVIKKGYYHTDGVHAPWMCWSLSMARQMGIITILEYELAREEIKKYLRDHTTLRNKLRDMGLLYAYQDCLRIYQNWSNRPT